MKQNSKNLFHSILLGILIICFANVKSEDTESINQSLHKAQNQIISLDSETEWEYTIDEIEKENILKNNYDQLDWKKYKVPSNLQSKEVDAKKRIWIRRKIIIPENRVSQNKIICDYRKIVYSKGISRASISTKRLR